MYVCEGSLRLLGRIDDASDSSGRWFHEVLIRGSFDSADQYAAINIEAAAAAS
jgi:hypothetical protein